MIPPESLVPFAVHDSPGTPLKSMDLDLTGFRGAPGMDRSTQVIVTREIAAMACTAEGTRLQIGPRR
jgi:hypothetical protein